MEEKTISKKESWKEELNAINIKRESSLVKEISSRFTGNSVPITEAEFQKQLRTRAYAKIKSFNYVSKHNIKNLNSPRKQLLMKEWSEVVASEKVGELSSQSAIDFLGEYGVHQAGMDEEQWKEWLEAIEKVTENVTHSRSMENLAGAAEAEANTAAERNADIALQIEAPHTPVSAGHSSRSLSPTDVLTYAYDESSTPFLPSNKATPQDASLVESKDDLTEVATRLSMDEIALPVEDTTPTSEPTSGTAAQASVGTKKFSYSKLESSSDPSPKNGGSGGEDGAGDSNSSINNQPAATETTPLVSDNSLNSTTSVEILESLQAAQNAESASELDTSSNRTESNSEKRPSFSQPRINSTGSTKNPLTLNHSNNVSDREYSPKSPTLGAVQPINVSSLPAQGTTKFVRPPLEPAGSISTIGSDMAGSSMCSEYTTTTEDEDVSELPPVLHIDTNMSVISSIGDDDAATAHNPNQIIKVAPVYHIKVSKEGGSERGAGGGDGTSMKSPVANSSSGSGGSGSAGVGGGQQRRSLGDEQDDEAEDDSVASRRQGNFFGCFFACCFKQPPKKKKEDKGKLIDKNSVNSSGGTTLKRSLEE